ncbi:MAG: hypothetical protein E6J02_09675 [Chloroflexi bacterium]|nr:MAG: hypothetical protein E6J02_09675 [Chloroflexota bacterium]
MQTRPRTRDTVRRLEAALALVRQERWMLTGLRGGRMVVLGERPSPPEGSGGAGAKTQRVCELSPLGRRSLYERRPVAVSGLTLEAAPPPADDEEWESTWPTLLYAPVAEVQERPVGLLILGSRRPSWYDDDDISYVCALAATLTTFVLAALDPLRGLSRAERMVAYLVAEGLSGGEVARALKLERPEAIQVIQNVLKKLQLRSRTQVAELLESAPGRQWSA